MNATHRRLTLLLLVLAGLAALLWMLLPSDSQDGPVGLPLELLAPPPAGPGPGQAPEPAPQVQTDPFTREDGLTRVLVIDASTRAPIQGARISRIEGSAETGWSVAPVADTDQDGKAVVSPRMALRVRAEGYATRSLVLGDDQETLIELTAAGVLRGQVIRVTGEPVRGLGLSVGLEFAQPAPSAEDPMVQARDALVMDEGHRAIVRTDESGRFEVSGLPVGPAILEILDDGYVVVDSSHLTADVRRDRHDEHLVVLAELLVAAVVLQGPVRAGEIDLTLRLPTGLREIVPVASKSYRMRTTLGQASRCERKISRSVRRNVELAAVVLPRFFARTETGAHLDPERLAVDGRVRLGGRTCALGGVSIRPLKIWTPDLAAVVPFLDETKGYGQVSISFLHCGEVLQDIVPCRFDSLDSPGASYVYNRERLRMRSGEAPGLLVPYGRYRLRPCHEFPWIPLPSTFEERDVLIQDEVVDLTVDLDDPVTVVDLRVVDEFGRPIRALMVGTGRISGMAYTGIERYRVRDEDSMEIYLAPLRFGQQWESLQRFFFPLKRHRLNSFVATLHTR